MSVQNRIQCLEDFTHQMIARKKEIVNLIVWEIGKSVTDAGKEFERTITYITETVKAAKQQFFCVSGAGKFHYPRQKITARRGVVYGAIQLSPERNLYHPYSGSHHGEHHFI